MLMNLHTHTHHSTDAAAETVAARITAAKALGLQYMAITDHCEVNRYEPASFYGAVETEEFGYDNRRVLEGSLTETAAEQAHCEGLRLLCGIELGQIPQDIETSRAIYNDPRMDLVIGSVHELPGLPDFYFLDYEHCDIPALISAYFAEVLALAQTDCYDVLGHLTYGLRYLPNRTTYDLKPHLPLIQEIYRAVIAQDKAIELNGSGLKANPPFTDPDVSLLRLYRALGGTRLTLSTDAHESRYLGLGMETLEQMARDAGFAQLTYFVKHQPHQIPL